MNDRKVDEVVSEVDGMKSFKLVVKEVREYYTTVIVDAEDIELAEESYYEVVHPGLEATDWVWVDGEVPEIQVTEVDELNEKERELPRITQIYLRLIGDFLASRKLF